MSYPISELVRQNILDALARVRVLNGYSIDITEAHPLRQNGQNSVGDGVAWLGWDDDEPNEDSPINFTSWATPYKVLVQVFEPDGSDLLQQRVRLATADIHKLVMQDVTWGGYAQNTFIESSQQFTDPTDITGVLVRFRVHWRHLDDDPYSMTE